MTVAILPEFTTTRLNNLSVEAALARRNHEPGTGPVAVARQLQRAEARLGLGPGLSLVETPNNPEMPQTSAAEPRLRPARLPDVPRIAALMASFVQEGTLLARPMAELFQCLREFHVVEEHGEVVACAALRILWGDLGEVRSLVVAPGYQGRGLGVRLVERIVEDARQLGLPRVIALTRTPAFFERAGFRQVERETLPRKIWTDCIHCPRRHACDETAMVRDLEVGATVHVNGRELDSLLPLPPRRHATTPA
jgi:amino-acid N-acetyltransferase